jgi:hypothetical protein
MNFFGKIVINIGKNYTEYRNSFIALPSQGIELCKLYLQRLLAPKIQKYILQFVTHYFFHPYDC